MQNRELNYLVRMKFIEYLETFPIATHPDYYGVDELLKYYERAPRSYKANKNALLEELKIIITGIRDNDLNHIGFGNYIPTGHYFTDYIAIALTRYFKGCMDPTMKIEEHKIGKLTYYIKDHKVSRFEIFIDHVIAIKSLYKINEPYPDNAALKALVDFTLNEMATRVISSAIVVPHTPVYITSASTDYSVTEDGIIETIERKCPYKYGVDLGVYETELDYLIHHGMNLIDADAAISNYLGIYNDLLNGEFKSSVILAITDKYAKIEAYITFDQNNYPNVTREMLAELVSYRNHSVQMIVAKTIDDWCNENNTYNKDIPWSYFFGAYTVRENLIKGLRVDYGEDLMIIAEWEAANLNAAYVNEFIEHFDHVDRVRGANKVRNSAIHVAAYIKGFDNKDDVDKFVDKYYGEISYAVSQRINSNEHICKEGITAGDLDLKNRVSTSNMVMFSFRLNAPTE